MFSIKSLKGRRKNGRVTLTIELDESLWERLGEAARAKGVWGETVDYVGVELERALEDAADPEPREQPGPLPPLKPGPEDDGVPF